MSPAIYQRFRPVAAFKAQLTSDAEKEAQIIAIFAKHGVTVRFVDEATP